MRAVGVGWMLKVPVLPAAGALEGRIRWRKEQWGWLDISKKDAKVCVRVAGTGRRKAVETVTTWSSMTSQILALREHLASERVTCVVMEATSDYVRREGA